MWKCVNASAWETGKTANNTEGFEAKLTFFPRAAGVVSVSVVSVETLEVAIHKFDKTLCRDSQRGRLVTILQCIDMRAQLFKRIFISIR